MGEKSEQKKQFIVDTARQVFVEKGFRDVTMKDIVDACGISRGGLYLYFDSTAALFREVLEAQQMEKDDIFTGEIPEEATATDILLVFLKEQKKEILLRKTAWRLPPMNIFSPINRLKRITSCAEGFFRPWKYSWG